MPHKYVVWQKFCVDKLVFQVTGKWKLKYFVDLPLTALDWGWLKQKKNKKNRTWNNRNQKRKQNQDIKLKKKEKIFHQNNSFLDNCLWFFWFRLLFSAVFGKYFFYFFFLLPSIDMIFFVDVFVTTGSLFISLIFVFVSFYFQFWLTLL